jgi:hypothetical protein
MVMPRRAGNTLGATWKELAPMLKKHTIPRVCQQCGTSFLVPPSRLKRPGYAQFCSALCKKRAMIKTPEQALMSLLARATRIPPPDHVRHLDDCLAVLSVQQNSYASVAYSGRKTQAHRFVYEQTHGALASGLMVCHRCDRRTCININHLFAGTREDNMADRYAKQREARGVRVGGAKLTDDAVREIRARYAAGGVIYADLAMRYGVSLHEIARVVLRQVWRHVE